MLKFLRNKYHDRYMNIADICKCVGVKSKAAKCAVMGNTNGESAADDRYESSHCWC